MKREVRSKSVGTKVTEAELRVLESRAERAGLTLSEWVRDVLQGSSIETGTLAAERAILAEVLAMRTILLNFMLKVGEGTAIPEESDKKLIAWADANKMKRRTTSRLRTLHPHDAPKIYASSRFGTHGYSGNHMQRASRCVAHSGNAD